MTKQEIKLTSKRLNPGSYKVTDPAGRIYTVETQEARSDWEDNSQSARTSWHLSLTGYVEASTPLTSWDGYVYTYGSKADAMTAIREENEVNPELSKEQRAEIEDYKRHQERWKTGTVSITIK